jgi:hypothetical protein
MRTEDSHLAKLAAPEDETLTVDPVDVALPEPMIAVPVRDESPALGSWQSVSLSTVNPVKQLLPQDPRRRKAVILSDAQVVICTTREEAQAATGASATGGLPGFVLAAGIPIPVSNKAACYVTYAGSAPSGVVHVSVLVEKDDD